MNKLRLEFKHETGMNWENSQGEPDIDYVNWLEERIQTAEHIIIKDSLRRTGRTTRLIDAAVQDFFTNGWVIIRDHRGEKLEQHHYVLDKFLKRLEREHGITEDLLINRNNCLVTNLKF